MADLREELEGLISGPFQRAEDAERAARAAEALALYMRADDRAGELLGLRVTGREADPEARDLNDLTLHDAAERVLDEAGIPLHVSELGRRIKAGGWTHKRSKTARRDQINYSLAARLPRYEQFVRVAPNTFGLRKWGTELPKSPKPRLGLFRSGARDTSTYIGEHPDVIFED